MKAFPSMVLLLSLGMLSSVGAETKSSLRSNDKQGRLEQEEEKGTGSAKSKRQLYVKHTPQAAAYSYTVVGSVQQDPKQTKEDPVEAATPAWEGEEPLYEEEEFLGGEGTPAPIDYSNIPEAPRAINAKMFGKADACKKEEHKVEMIFVTDEYSEADNEVYLVQQPNITIWNYARGSFKTFFSAEDEKNNNPRRADYYFATCVKKTNCYTFEFVDAQGDFDFFPDGDFFAELILNIDGKNELALKPDTSLPPDDWEMASAITGKEPISSTKPYKYQVLFGTCT